MDEPEDDEIVRLLRKVGRRHREAPAPEPPKRCGVEDRRLLIPLWYGLGMEAKTQVTVRLSAETVQHMDEAVAAGIVVSRAAYLEHAAEWQRRREGAERDAAILAGIGEPYPDLDGFTEHTSRTPLDID
jgi:Arc/MetJ-type ribon-helix-helix transcriptional regulator